MKKLYKEQQYREYENFMDRIANTDDMLDGFYIHQELKQWIIDNSLPEVAIEQMDKRLEEDFVKECSQESNKDFKVIEFPKKES
jgi:hypothetical protein